MSETDRTFGAVTVVVGAKNGKYPSGNSLWITGRDATAIVDPSLSVVERAGEFAGGADLIVHSHVHEDHVAGVHLFPNAEVVAHREDVIGLLSLNGLMTMYGYDTNAVPGMEEFVLSQFHYVARPDTRPFEDGAVFDLGGTRLRAIHLPGHTRGHCALLAEPEGVLFLGDIDLTGFGPYYGDAWSDLEAFEVSLARVREVEARVWVSFHHAGVIDDRRVFLDKLAGFAAKITAREEALLAFLREPRTVDEMVAHRFLYPPHATLAFIDAAERRTTLQHLERLLRRKQIECCGPDQYRALA